jgi:hypothetical protein
VLSTGASTALLSRHAWTLTALHTYRTGHTQAKKKRCLLLAQYPQYCKTQYRSTAKTQYRGTAKNGSALAGSHSDMPAAGKRKAVPRQHSSTAVQQYSSTAVQLHSQTGGEPVLESPHHSHAQEAKHTPAHWSKHLIKSPTPHRYCKHNPTPDTPSKLHGHNLRHIISITSVRLMIFAPLWHPNVGRSIYIPPRNLLHVRATGGQRSHRTATLYNSRPPRQSC